MRLHVRTPRRNKSVYDRYTNLLRATTEALSAALGGCDRLTVEPFGFDAHLALNVQRMLQEEAHLDAVADPAGGSYYIEALTDSLAREAWKLFQQVEAEGGYAKALASGSIDKALAASPRGAREGRRRAAPHAGGRQQLPQPDREDSRRGAAGQTTAPLPGIPPGRAVREDPPAHRRATRTRPAAIPKVLLLKRGDVKMRRARANFCLNFFGCAGFDIVEVGRVRGHRTRT